MLSRRSLLRLGSLGVGLGWSSTAQAQRGGAAPPSGPLPPSITALQSMKGRARPFTDQERAGGTRESEAGDGRGKDRRDPDERRHLANVLREHVVRRR